MFRMIVKTEKTPAEVLETASEFFGPEGQGFKVIVKTNKIVSFDDGIGGTIVAVSGEDHETSVDLRTLKNENQIKEFADKIR